MDFHRLIAIMLSANGAPLVAHLTDHDMNAFIPRLCIGMAFITGSFQVAASPSEPSDEPPVRPSYDQCLHQAQGVTVSINNCIGDEFDFQDKRLNIAYKGLRDSMDDSQKRALRNDERAWIAERDKACAPPKDGGTADMLAANECQLDRTARRAQELEAKRSSLPPRP